MTTSLVKFTPKGFHFSVRVPNEWDYFTNNGKRVNLFLSKVPNNNNHGFTGFYLIVWIFCITFAWRETK